MNCTKVISAVDPCHIGGKMVLAPCTYYKCKPEPEVQSSILDQPGFQAFLVILGLILLAFIGFGIHRCLKNFDVTFTRVFGSILVGAFGFAGFSATRNTAVPDLEGQNSENRAAALHPV